MPLLETLPVDDRTAQWEAWSTTVRTVATDPSTLPLVRDVVRREMAAVERACSRFREDSELRRAERAADGRPAPVSPLLAALVDAALLAARRTGGDVDPTVATSMDGLGYDRDLGAVARVDPDGRLRIVPAAGWERVGRSRRDGEELLALPRGVRLDLGATAKAWTADRCARVLLERGIGGVLVGIGGDLATAGASPEGAWTVRVQDGPDQPADTVALPDGTAIATSSTLSRTWRRGGRTLHHVVDPRTGAPAAEVWRTVSVVTGSCVEANTLTTSAVVRGVDARGRLRELGVAARLVDAGGRVEHLGGWSAAA